MIVLYGRRRVGKTTVRDNNAVDGLRVAETEIDLLGIGRGAKEYLVGECKLKKSPFSYSEYLDTIAKLTPLKQKAKFYYALLVLPKKMMCGYIHLRILSIISSSLNITTYKSNDFFPSAC